MSIASPESVILGSWSEKSKNSVEVETLAQNSYENPRHFWEELLKSIQTKHGVPFQSTLFQNYHIYHDCIVRHLNQKLIALKTLEENSWREWSYDYIHRLVNYQVKRWQNQLESWSGNVAIVMPLGINFFVGVLTAVRLGLPFTVLPLDSPLLPTRRIRSLLDQLNVELILTTPEASSTIPGDERHWLIEYLEESEKYDEETVYCYKPDSRFQFAYSSHTQDEGALVPVKAEEMYLNALRDGDLTFGLKKGDSWGYCPDCSLREQPFLLLTALLYGATTVILPQSQLQQNSELVSSFSLDILGVTPVLRDLWTGQEGLPKSKLSLWYYNLFDDDQKAWATFIQKNKLEKVSSVRLVIDNASGGVPITSISVEDEVRDPLWPSFGVSWKLLQYEQQEVSSVHPYGIFKQDFASDFPSNFLLFQQRVGWEVASTVSPQKRGYTIPVKEMEQTAMSLDFVDFAFFIDLPIPHSSLRTQSILLLFVNPFLREELPKQQGDWIGALNQKIKESLGSSFIPDKVEFFPLIPRIEEGKLDRQWCYYQYISGLLSRKKTLKVYQWLSMLKKSVLEGKSKEQ